MRIKKIFNNNVVTTIGEDHEEIILSGAGIGFQKHPGDRIDKSKIMKTYHLRNIKREKLYQLLERTSITYLQYAEAILTHTFETFGIKCSDSLLLSLAEHIEFAINRYHDNEELPNLILSEIRAMYAKEYEIGLWSIDFLNKNEAVKLSDDEAGYIALHIINATTGIDKLETRLIIEFIRHSIVVFSKTFTVTLSEESQFYDRFVIHLKFLVNRILSQVVQQESGDIQDMFDLMLKRNKQMELFISRMQRLFQHHFGYTLTEHEQVYLMIHAQRILDVYGKNKGE